MNLSETDKELIAEMDKRLKHLEILLDEALSKETPESLTEWLLSKRKQPAVDVVEPPEYVRCDYSAVNHVTEGKAYKVQKVTVNHIYIIDRTGAIVGYPHSYFSSITREEFDRQQPTKEVEKELSEPKQEERFKPKAAREVYFYISDYGEIMKAEFFNDYLDTERYKIGNCFRTEEAATKAAQAIRETLKNL